MTDPIDKAIDATEQMITMQQIPVMIASTGRPAAIDIPADCTEAELAELAGWMLTQVLTHIRAQHEARRSPIVIARGLPS